MKVKPGGLTGGGNPRPRKPYGIGFSDSAMGNKTPKPVTASKPKDRKSPRPRVAESRKKK